MTSLDRHSGNKFIDCAFDITAKLRLVYYAKVAKYRRDPDGAIVITRVELEKTVLLDGDNEILSTPATERTVVATAPWKDVYDD